MTLKEIAKIFNVPVQKVKEHRKYYHLSYNVVDKRINIVAKYLFDSYKLFKWKQLCDYYNYGFCKNPNGCKCKKDYKEFYKPKKRPS